MLHGYVTRFHMSQKAMAAMASRPHKSGWKESSARCRTGPRWEWPVIQPGMISMMMTMIITIFYYSDYYYYYCCYSYLLIIYCCCC